MKKRRDYRLIGWQPTVCQDDSAKGSTVRWLVLEVDVYDLLRWLGEKAKQTKSRKSQIAHGAVRVLLKDKSPH